MDSLNVCVGIDAGSYESELAYSDELSTRIITRIDGFDLLSLRDEPIFSCVVASSSRVMSETSGFSDVHVIPQSEAVILALGSDGRNIVCDLGEAACRMYVVNAHDVIDTEIIGNVCGRVIAENFAEYLAERYRFSARDYEVLHEARRIKHALTENEITSWRERDIYRYELERVIHFPVKRAARTLQRLVRVHKPESVILTGGNVKIPEVRRVIADVIGMTPERRLNLIADGAAKKARELQRNNVQRKKPDTASRLRELRTEMLTLEDRFTRHQKDRVYAIFRQAEGINDAGIITLMENMLREIRSV